MENWNGKAFKEVCRETGWSAERLSVALKELEHDYSPSAIRTWQDARSRGPKVKTTADALFRILGGKYNQPVMRKRVLGGGKE